VLDFLNGSTTPGARYLQGMGAVVDQVLAREKPGSVSWYLPDRLGTIRDLVDNTGTIIDHVDYNAYGTASGETVPAQGDRLMGFAGLERDTATGLNLAVYRVQDPGTGRWDSQDPIGYAGNDINLYRYIRNSPTDFIDLSGLSGIAIALPLAGGASLADGPQLLGGWGSNMKWWAAHLIMYFEYIEINCPEPSSDDAMTFVAWENIVLFGGDTLEEIRHKANERGKFEEKYGGDDLRYGKHKVRMLFGGIRKIVECECENQDSLADGDEVTYSELKVIGKERLNRLIAGDEVEMFVR
jgi:RHS repeat-associated protein